MVRSQARECGIDSPAVGDVNPLFPTLDRVSLQQLRKHARFVSEPHPVGNVLLDVGPEALPRLDFLEGANVAIRFELRQYQRH